MIDTLLRNARSALILFFFWMFGVIAITFILTASSPHGGAALIYCGAFLSLLGAVGQVLVYLNVHPSEEKDMQYRVYVGALSGLVSWLVSMMIDAHGGAFQVNTYVLFLLVYLCLLGAAAGWATAKAVTPRLSRV